MSPLGWWHRSAAVQVWSTVTPRHVSKNQGFLETFFFQSNAWLHLSVSGRTKYNISRSLKWPDWQEELHSLLQSKHRIILRPGIKRPVSGKDHIIVSVQQWGLYDFAYKAAGGKLHKNWLNTSQKASPASSPTAWTFILQRGLVLKRHSTVRLTKASACSTCKRLM